MLEKFISKIDLNSIGSVVSIIGLILTIYVLISLKKLRNEFAFKGRIPRLQKRLQKHTSMLSTLLQNYENSVQDIDQEIGLAMVDIKSIQKKVTGDVKKSTNALIKEIKNYQSKKENKTEDDVRNIYVKCNTLILEIQNLREDLSWS